MHIHGEKLVHSVRFKLIAINCLNILNLRAAKGAGLRGVTIILRL